MHETYLSLLRDWPHWAFEGTVEVATFLLLTWPARYLVRRHDRKEHQAAEFEAPAHDHTAVYEALEELRYTMQAALMEQAQEIRLLKRRLDK